MLTDRTVVTETTLRGYRVGLHVMYQPQVATHWVALAVHSSGEWAAWFNGRTGIFDAAFDMRAVVAAGGVRPWSEQLMAFANDTLPAWFSALPAPPPPPAGEPTTIDELTAWLRASLELADTPYGPVLRPRAGTPPPAA